MIIVTPKKLEEWNDTNKRLFEGLLPELVKKLIIASNTSVKYNRFPSNDDIWAPGYDGVAVCNMDSEYVKAGNSVWEFGTSSASLEKINGDYKKRTSNPLGFDKKQTSFYLVLPKIWAFKSISLTEWENTHCDWKQVKVYDAVQLCDWINKCPSVCAWLLGKIDTTCEYKFSTVLKAWDKLSKMTEPRFVTEMFTGGRKEESELFREKLEKTSDNIFVKADTRIDAIGFVLAELKDNENYMKHAIVVENEETLSDLMRITENQLFVLNFSFEGYLSNNNNRVIICLNNEATSIKNAIELSSLKKSVYEEALRKMGVQQSEISDIFAFTHCNLRALIRRKPGNIVEQQPDWAKKESVDALAPLVLLRTINKDKDKEIVEKLSGGSFSDIEKIYHELLRIEDSPLKIVCNNYVIVNYEEAWAVLGLNPSEYHFDLLLKLIKELSVQSINNDFNGRNFYELKTVTRYLIWNYVYYSYEQDVEGKIDNAIKEILSLSYVKPFGDYILENLSMLAEARPRVVMDFLNEDQKNEKGLIKKSFIDYDIYSENDYCVVLDAIDELTKYEETITDACKLLFKLCGIERNYYYSNCPQESLISALCLWKSDGSATIVQKEKLVNYFLNENEEKSFKLVIKLITKDSYYVCSRLGQKRKKGDAVSIKDYFDTRERIIKKLFEIAIQRKNGEYIYLLIREYEMMRCEVLVEYADKFDIAMTDFDSVNRINFFLRNRIFDIKRFERKQQYDYLEALNYWVKKTTFDDELKSYLWVFRDANDCPALELLESADDFNKHDGEVFKYRKRVFRKIYTQKKFEAIDIILRNISDSVRWGYILSEVIPKRQFEKTAMLLVELNKISTLSGLLDEYDVKYSGKFILNLEKNDELIKKLSNRELLTYLNEDEKKLFWGNKEMRVFSSDEYNNILQYNPMGLISFLYLKTKEKPEDYISTAFEVFNSLKDHDVNDGRLKRDQLLSIIENIDDVFYSEEWANLCLAICKKYEVYSYPECIRILYYDNPGLIRDIANSSLERFMFVNAYELPQKAYSNYREFENFVIQLGKIENDFDYTFVGRILGKSKFGEDGFFPHEVVREILEVLDDKELDYEVAGYYDNLHQMRYISDGQDMIKKAKEFSKYASSIEIDYPHTAVVLRRISEIYASEAKREYIESEIRL